MEERLGSQRVSLDAHVLGDGVRQASARSEEPILCIAKGQSITFVAVSGLRLVASWEYCLRMRLVRPAIFVIPPMIVSHLLAVPPPGAGQTALVLEGNQVILHSCDKLGSYQLHWRSDPRTFPAPPEMNRLLVVPPRLARLGYVDVSDAVHQAVVDLIQIESQRQIHRTRMAVMVRLVDGRLVVTGQEIEPRAGDHYYFDPRLVIRALELIRAEYVEVGVTNLGPRSAFLSIVDRQPERLVHCALLSIGLDTQRLFPLPRGRAA